jgi:hypothetical protein
MNTSGLPAAGSGSAGAITGLRIAGNSADRVGTMREVIGNVKFPQFWREIGGIPEK